MVKNRRHTETHNFRDALEARESSRTIIKCLNDRIPVEEHFVLGTEPAHLHL